MSGADIFLLSIQNQESSALLATKANEWLAEISPNGRFIAYVSDESGRDEVGQGLNQPIDLTAESNGRQCFRSQATDHDEVSEANQGLGAEADDRWPGERPDAEGGYA